MCALPERVAQPRLLADYRWRTKGAAHRGRFLSREAHLSFGSGSGFFPDALSTSQYIDKVNTTNRMSDMDIHFELNGDQFVWNDEKADLNWHKHGVRFEESATVFADPLFVLMDATRNDESRDAAIGFDATGRLPVFSRAYRVRSVVYQNHFRPASGTT